MPDIPDCKPLIPDLRKNFKECIDKTKMYQEDIDKLDTCDAYAENFLIHHKGVVDNAVKMVAESFIWRKTFGVRELNDDTLPRNRLEQGIMYYHNKDKQGRQILVINTRATNKGETCDEKKQLLAWLLELASQACPDKQIVVLMDLHNCGLSHVDLGFTRFLVDCFSKYYPNMLALLINYEMPWLMNAAWKIIKGWLSKEEQDVIKFEKKATIQNYIEADQLAEHMGGTDTWTYKYIPKQAYTS